MAKIAVELEGAVRRRREAGSAETIASRVLAEGRGWRVTDVVCTAGPHDRIFEEQHQNYSISLVAAGTFQYGSSHAREMMTPGSLLLGNPGQCFECGHEHGDGDRCLSFQYTPEYFEEIAGEAQVPRRLKPLRIPPVRELSPLLARAASALDGYSDLAWEELALAVAARTAQVAGEVPINWELPAGALARVTRVVRRIDAEIGGPLDLATLARDARLSPYHFLRTFGRLTGLTPHQYILRTRLRRAAVRLIATREKVLDIALDSGFGDVSNFNRAFRAEFGMSPRAYRAG